MRKSTHSKCITSDCVTLQLQAKEKFAAIRELLELLTDTQKVQDKELAWKDLKSREEKMSTGLEMGIALPHAKTEAVTELIAAIGISSSGIDFESLDQQPSHIILMVLSPKGKSGPHIEFLAHFTQRLKNPVLRKRILEATDPAQVVEILTN